LRIANPRIALSESEHGSSDVEHAPLPNKGKGKGKAPVEEDPVEDSEEDDSEGPEDEYAHRVPITPECMALTCGRYVVEAIHGHRFQKVRVDICLRRAALTASGHSPIRCQMGGL
jgi:hypothetical protein